MRVAPLLFKFDIPKAKVEGITNGNIIDIVHKLGYIIINYERMRSDSFDFDCALVEVEASDTVPPVYLIPMPHLWVFDKQYKLN